jgi:O-antigen/teichoic acid export membrane protein
MFWRGLVGYLPVQLAQGIVGVLSIVVFTRLLSPAEYGHYALGFSAMALAHTLCFTWIEAAMARFYQAEAAGDADPGDLFATLYRSWLVLALGFPLVCGLVLWAWPASLPVKLAIGAGLVSILAHSLSKLVQERLRAAGQVRASALLDLGRTIGGFAAGAGLIALGWGGAAPLAGMGVMAAISLAFVLPGELRIARKGRFDPARARTYASYGLPVAASLILALVLATTDRFLLAAFLNEPAVGVYHAGYSLANRTLDVAFVWLGMAGGPAMIAALERGGREALAASAREQAALMAALAIPAAAGLALVARPLAEVMVGPALREGAAATVPWIALSALFAGVTTYYFHQAFTLARRTRLLLAAMAVPAVANLALTLILIPRFGLNGALWSTAASYVLGAVASWAIGRRVLALPIPWEAIAKAALATAAMALAVSQVPATGGAIELFAKAGLGMAIYALAAAVLDIGGLRSRAQHFLAARRGALA